MQNFDWWYKFEAIARLQGLPLVDFKWSLEFKPEGYYLDKTWTMNTTCWYIHVEVASHVCNYCAEQAADAVNLAIAKSIKELEESLESWKNSPNKWTPSRTVQEDWRNLLQKMKQIANQP